MYERAGEIERVVEEQAHVEFVLLRPVGVRLATKRPASSETVDGEESESKASSDRVDQRVLKERSRATQTFLGEHNGAHDVECRACESCDGMNEKVVVVNVKVLKIAGVVAECHNDWIRYIIFEIIFD